MSQTQSQHARFSKSDLSNAVVLGQVDRKFIACVMSGSDLFEAIDPEGLEDDGGMLVLIDQHAADERIRVERFMRELCKGFVAPHGTVETMLDVRTLDQPVQVLLTAPEAKALAVSDTMQATLKRWGIAFGPLPDLVEDQEDEMDLFPARKKRSERGKSGYVQVEVTSVPEVVATKVSPFPISD